MPRVYHKCNAPKDAIYVGRPTKFGNPFVIGKDGTRQEVIEKYRNWLENNLDIKNNAILLLQNKDLVCWCAPLPCHADILLEVANAKAHM